MNIKQGGIYPANLDPVAGREIANALVAATRVHRRSDPILQVFSNRKTRTSCKTSVALLITSHGDHRKPERLCAENRKKY